MKIYGPVPSWRLGNSLGVDLVEAPNGFDKICSYNCLYCQLGHNTFKTDTPKEIPVNESDFVTLKKRIKETKPDYITFSGEGEPTLNSNLGYVAKRIKEITDIPVVVLTNASLIINPEVRAGLDCCDLVIAKIDAASQKLFNTINQPYEGIMLDDITKRIGLLRTNAAIQTLLFSYNGLTNCSDKAIAGLIRLYKKINDIKPINIFLGTAYRPTDKEGVLAIDEKRIEEVAFQITEKTGLTVKYYTDVTPKSVNQRMSPEQLEKELIALCERRPCTMEDLKTRFPDRNVLRLVSSLVGKCILEERLSGNKKFYFAK